VDCNIWQFGTSSSVCGELQNSQPTVSKCLFLIQCMIFIVKESSWCWGASLLFSFGETFCQKFFLSHHITTMDCTLIEEGRWEVGIGIFSPHLGWHIYELLVILGFWWSSSATKITFIYRISKNVHNSMPVYMCPIVVLSLHNKIGKFSWDWHVVEAIMISFLTLKHWCLSADCTNWICFINSVTES
jgi:hypothetical protein